MRYEHIAPVAQIDSSQTRTICIGPLSSENTVKCHSYGIWEEVTSTTERKREKKSVKQYIYIQ